MFLINFRDFIVGSLTESIIEIIRVLQLTSPTEEPGTVHVCVCLCPQGHPCYPPCYTCTYNFKLLGSNPNHPSPLFTTFCLKS